jgi:hypothetical protein
MPETAALRFVEIVNGPVEFTDPSGDTKWYWDTARPLPEGGFVAKQVYADKNPNDFRRIENLTLLFTDQCEYYAVCQSCREVYCGMQWSGSTRGGRDWERRAVEYLLAHLATKGWCEFCDPVFGNRGWSR